MQFCMTFYYLRLQQDQWTLQEIGQAFKIWENIELQMSKAGDPPSGAVSLSLENCLKNKYYDN